MQLDIFPSPDHAPHRSDPAMIARGIFQYEVTEALKVLRTCGALRTESERIWCQQELERLLVQLCPGTVS